MTSGETSGDAALRVDSGFLRRRFWFAVAIVLAPVAAATFLSILALRETTIANHFANAFGRLNSGLSGVEFDTQSRRACG